MFDPDDNLKFAMRIHGDRKMRDEAGIRAAVSRCYYASLLTVKPYLGSHEIDVGDELHKTAIFHVQKINRDLGDQLRYLYRQRLKADLCEDASWDEDAIVGVYGVAKQINSEVERAGRASGGSLPST